MDPQSLPPNEISERQLKFGYWFVTHKLALRRALIFSLLVLSAGIWLFALGMLVKLYLLDYNRDVITERELSRSLVNPAAIAAALPKPLLQKQATSLPGGSGLFDAYAEVGNPNSRFWASWNGRFAAENTTTTRRMEFILPGETKAVMDLGVESPAGLRSLRYELTDLIWHKIDPHQIKDYTSYRDERLNFEISGIQFSSEPAKAGKGTISRVKFRASNHSAYGFWTVRFVVKLYRGTTLLGVNSVELQQFETGESREIELVWPQELLAISKVEVAPEVNILDPQVFMPPKVSK